MFFAVSTVNVATLKEHADELVARAIAGEATVIELNGKRAVLLPCDGTAPDFELDPNTDHLLQERMRARGSEPTKADWEALRRRVRGDEPCRQVARLG